MAGYRECMGEKELGVPLAELIERQKQWQGVENNYHAATEMSRDLVVEMKAAGTELLIVDL